MKRTRFTPSILLATLATLLAVASTALALDANKDGWYHTGDGIRTKSVAFINVKVYAIGHDMKALPPSKSKQAVIEADVDKRITWKMLRDVDHEKIVKALKEAYALNGYGDAGKIAQAMSAFSGELKENSYVTISYNSTNKTTTFNALGGGGSATVSGVDFMKGTWSIWFGKIDQPSLGDAMLSRW
jgi:hypothetical protein